MNVEGYVKRKITEEQRLKLQAHVKEIIDNQHEVDKLTEVKVTRCKYLGIFPYNKKETVLKKEYEDTKLYKLFPTTAFYNLYIEGTKKMDNLYQLSKLFSGEDALEAYLSPTLSQSLTNFLKEIE